jgi:hypothetical protein
VVGKAAQSWREHSIVIIVADPNQADADLAGCALSCPHCGGRLPPWSYAAVRRVRLLDGATQPVRPRRARCAACRPTQLLRPRYLLPRRADATEVIGAALVAKATGRGWRRIAAELGRPPGTVHRWLRTVRGPHLAWLHRRGVEPNTGRSRQWPAAVVEVQRREAAGWQERAWAESPLPGVGRSAENTHDQAPPPKSPAP